MFKLSDENWWIVDDDIWGDSSLGRGPGGVVYDERVRADDPRGQC